MGNNVRETILQFGEGGFLRSFADKFVDVMNKRGTYDGKIVVVQPIQNGLCDRLNAQGGRYNLFLRGISGGKQVCERTEIESISRAINPYEDYDALLDAARSPDMRIVISNTTEAGIEYIGTESMADRPPKSFPAKLTVCLYERYRLGLNGFIILSCELIDRNGDELKKCVLKYANLWKLGDGFTEWLERENHFCSTLVDRICTGYPKDPAEKAELSALCPGDSIIDTAEIFHLWVIEGNFEDEFPLCRSGINAVWTDNVDPYKKRKVRILNGAHTSMVPCAYLYGMRTVGECMQEPAVRGFLERCVLGEILPVIG
ncbi:MAG: tagaturonate reductase, partial [Eubacteriales bacterium]